MLFLAGSLAACQPKTPVAFVAAPGKSAALRTMEQVALAAQNCWFAAKDPAFQNYRLSNELGSFSGRPRILIVPAKSMESRPVLVVQAEGGSARVESFGPLLDGGNGARISADIARWAKGDASCAAKA
ncbi:MAG: hypothetical protein Q8Q62_12725 [Mesorhizobium sp.]|nr:hypothetical protein [Mesorhizobium sp.]